MSGVTKPTITPELYLEISQFLFQEAEYLDERKFDHWLNLLAEDIVYRMPLRINREKKDGSDIVDTMSHFEEDLTTLKTRVARLGTTSAWSDDPPSRTRHFISNILIEYGDQQNELLVRSCFQFIRNRGTSPTNDQVTGKRLDLLRHINGQWKISKRTIYSDQAVLGTLNLNTLY